jgi:tetratricopeptide (TPR) repeat protein
MVAVFLRRAPQERVQQVLAQMAQDSHPLVQVAALSSLSPDWVEEHLTEIAELLRAEPLVVRLAAATIFSARPELIARLDSQRRATLFANLDVALSAAARQRELPAARVDLARIRLAWGFGSEAIREYRLILEKQPDYVPARVALAQMYLNQQRFEEALVQYTELAGSKPEDLASQVGAAQCLLPMGRAEEALTILEKVVGAAPTHMRAHLHLGRAYQALGRTEQAIAEWQEVLRLDPGNQEAQLLLRQVTKGSGEPRPPRRP